MPPAHLASHASPRRRASRRRLPFHRRASRSSRSFAWIRASGMRTRSPPGTRRSRTRLSADVPHDLLGLWLYPSAGGAVLLGPEALAQDDLTVPLPSPQVQPEQLRDPGGDRPRRRLRLDRGAARSASAAATSGSCWSPVSRRAGIEAWISWCFGSRPSAWRLRWAGSPASGDGATARRPWRRANRHPARRRSAGERGRHHAAARSPRH